MILTRYITKEILQTLAGILVVLLLIFLSHRFIRYLAQAGMGNLSSEFLLQLMALKLVNVLGLILPLAFFLAVLLALGRLYVDSEVTAMRACGIGLPFLLRHVGVLAAQVALVVAILTLLVTPWAESQQDVLQEQARKLAEVSGIAPGRFQGFAGGVFYVRELQIEHNRMQEIFVALEQNGKKIVLSAESARRITDEATGNRYLVLDNGYRYEGSPGHEEFTRAQYAEHAVLIHRAGAHRPGTRPEAMSSAELWRSNDRRHWAELQMRLSVPLAVVVLAPIAVLLSRTTQRQGRHANVLSAVLLYFVYGNLLEIWQKIMVDQALPSWLGLWWVHVLFLALGAVLWRQRRMG